MLLGHIVGKVTTTEFSFEVSGDAQKFDYVQVMHEKYDFVLCQIIEMTTAEEKTIATCAIIGYKDGTIKLPRVPFIPGTEVLKASDDFISEVISLQQTKGALIGKLEGRDIPIFLDLQKLLTKHIAILAKSGAGKSYCVGVLLEEILQQKVPLLIVDPHGEYETLKEKNSEDAKELKLYDRKPTGFRKQIQLYGDIKQYKEAKPLTISENLDGEELLQILPTKLSAAQEAVLFSVVKRVKEPGLDALLYALEQDESPAKWQIMRLIEYLKSQHIFSKNGLSYNELIRSGFCSILHLKGIPPQIQEILVYKILKDLFELRKQEKIPPFFCIIEEAHNFCPERSFGQSIATNVIRTIASEGRKFGQGLCIVSQRPARVDKSVLSQVSTQIILKVTNPNDLKALSNSVEGITSSSETEIQNLPIGHALLTGVVDVPLFVRIRPRMSKHGGQSVDIVQNTDERFFDKLEEFNEQEMLPLLIPNISKADMKLMNAQESKVKTALIPCALFMCVSKDQEFMILMDRITGSIVVNADKFQYAKLPELESLTPDEIATLKKAFSLKKFTSQKLISTSNFAAESSLKSLVKKGYIEKKGENFHISKSFILDNLNQYAIYKKIEFKSISFDKKLPPRFAFDTLREQLAKFTTVKDFRECFLVKYEAILPKKA